MVTRVPPSIVLESGRTLLMLCEGHVSSGDAHSLSTTHALGFVQNTQSYLAEPLPVSDKLVHSLQSRPMTSHL